MSEEEEKIIRQVKTMLENATPFDMPPSRYNALETMVNLIEKQQKEIENSVSKDKIRDKIKELYEDKDSKYYDMFLEERDIEKTISILKSIIGE